MSEKEKSQSEGCLTKVIGGTIFFGLLGTGATLAYHEYFDLFPEELIDELLVVFLPLLATIGIKAAVKTIERTVELLFSLLSLIILMMASIVASGYILDSEGGWEAFQALLGQFDNPETVSNLNEIGKILAEVPQFISLIPQAIELIIGFFASE